MRRTKFSLIISIVFFMALIQPGAIFAENTVSESAEETVTRSYIPKVMPAVFEVDDFEDGEASRFPRWWRFGDINALLMDTDESKPSYVGKKALKLRGKAEKWVVGGVGTYMGVDARKYNAIKLLVYGHGPESGRLMIELYDDDDGNYRVTPHEKYPHYILHDDKFVYTMPIRWEGWKVVIITLDKFVDDNPQQGDNIWNPYAQPGGGGGLIQMQFVGISNKESAEIEMDIDTIKFFKYKGEVLPDPKVDRNRYFL